MKFFKHQCIIFRSLYIKCVLFVENFMESVRILNPLFTFFCSQLIFFFLFEATHIINFSFCIWHRHGIYSTTFWYTYTICTCANNSLDHFWKIREKIKKTCSINNKTKMKASNIFFLMSQLWLNLSDTNLLNFSNQNYFIKIFYFK